MDLSMAGGRERDERWGLLVLAIASDGRLGRGILTVQTRTPASLAAQFI